MGFIGVKNKDGEIVTIHTSQLCNLNPIDYLKMETINEIANAVHENAKEKGFHPEGQTEREFINEQLMNLSDEISELHEAWRNGKLRERCDKADVMEAMGLAPLTCIEEEYADIVIRALDQCRRLGVDIAKAIEAKHAYNTTRPHRHGNKLS